MRKIVGNHRLSSLEDGFSFVFLPRMSFMLPGFPRFALQMFDVHRACGGKILFSHPTLAHNTSRLLSLQTSFPASLIGLLEWTRNWHFPFRDQVLFSPSAGSIQHAAA